MKGFREGFSLGRRGGERPGGGARDSEPRPAEVLVNVDDWELMIITCLMTRRAAVLSRRRRHHRLGGPHSVLVGISRDGRRAGGRGRGVGVLLGVSEVVAVAPLWARDGLRASPSARVALGPRGLGAGRRAAGSDSPRAAVARRILLLLLLLPRAGPSARELDAILARVAVMVSAATDMFPAKARETLAAHPELLAALARGDFDFDCDGVAETLLDEQPARDSDSSSSASDSDSSSSDASVHVALGALVDRHVAASLAFLGDEAGVPPAALGALVAAHPTVLGVRSRAPPPRVGVSPPPANRGGAAYPSGSRRRRGERPDDVDARRRHLARARARGARRGRRRAPRAARGGECSGARRRTRVARGAFFAVECGLGSAPPKRSRGGTRGWC